MIRTLIRDARSSPALRRWLTVLKCAINRRVRVGRLPVADPERPLFNLPDQQDAVDRGAFRIGRLPVADPERPLFNLPDQQGACFPSAHST
jgi:hypothetical protein